ncbi:hypothetical protein IAT38_007160 [Cryptococcus sp. DSM 104549]
MSRNTSHPRPNYPPAPPPSRGSRAPRPPPLRVNTSELPSSASLRSGSHSPAHSTFTYNLPPSLDHPAPATQPTARPGGFAAMTSGEGSSRVRSPPATPGSREHSRPGQWSRRGSNESSLPPPSTKRRVSDHSANHWRDAPLSPPLGSVYSGREGGSPHAKSERSRSPTALGLQEFAHHCRQFYFTVPPPPESANFISTTLASISPSHRAAYTRLQSSLRSLAHLYHLRVRISSFHALISSTVPSASLSLPARQEVTGARAKSERRESLSRFISTWCTTNTGGVEPFFRGLWGVLRAQSRGGGNRGGAGGKSVIWELDDAVFLESGGADFMHEAVIMLKGVLGFEDIPLTAPPNLQPSRAFVALPPRHQALPHKVAADPEEELAISLTEHATNSRCRATSDPFIDHPHPVYHRGPAPPPPKSRRAPPTIPNPLQGHSTPHHTPGSPLLAQTPSSAAFDDLPSHQQPGIIRSISEDRVHLLHGRTKSEASVDRTQGRRARLVGENNVDEPTEDDIAAEESDLNQPRFRLWSFPTHISNEEAVSMMGLFPRFVGKKGDIRFPFIRPRQGMKVAEEAGWNEVVIGGGEMLEPKVVKVPKIEVEEEEGVVRCGTGRMWVGNSARGAGWQGGGWFRFKQWCLRTLGMA